VILRGRVFSREHPKTRTFRPNFMRVCVCSRAFSLSRTG
jgi:hypothetical protein